mmetsp:Transcript_29844/g.92337  ORF Transcript_29844/g.92337 Transcript_29844/m.92337 type:complete len:180 (-) Transcript_29844:841-1380(-)
MGWDDATLDATDALVASLHAARDSGASISAREAKRMRKEAQSICDKVDPNNYENIYDEPTDEIIEGLRETAVRARTGIKKATKRLQLERVPGGGVVRWHASCNEMRALLMARSHRLGAESPCAAVAGIDGVWRLIGAYALATARELELVWDDEGCLRADRIVADARLGVAFAPGASVRE